MADAIPTKAPGTAPTVLPDERVRRASALTKAMRRPELGALAGLILVGAFFFVTADMHWPRYEATRAGLTTHVDAAHITTLPPP